MSDTPCRVTSDLRAYEQEQDMNDRNYKAFHKAALDDLCWRVLEHEEGRPFDYADFLAEQPDFSAMVLHAKEHGSWWDLFATMETRLRSRLEDSPEVEERAAELAREDS